jgi:plasmid stability protein
MQCPTIWKKPARLCCGYVYIVRPAHPSLRDVCGADGPAALGNLSFLGIGDELRGILSAAIADYETRQTVDAAVQPLGFPGSGDELRDILAAVIADYQSRQAVDTAIQKGDPI